MAAPRSGRGKARTRPASHWSSHGSRGRHTDNTATSCTVENGAVRSRSLWSASSGGGGVGGSRSTRVVSSRSGGGGDGYSELRRARRRPAVAAAVDIAGRCSSGNVDAQEAYRDHLDSGSDDVSEADNEATTSASVGGEVQIMKLLRKLNHEESLDRHETLCNSLQVALRSCSCAGIVSRWLEPMLERLYDCVCSAAAALFRQQLVPVLATLGEATARLSLFNRYIVLVFDSVDDSDSTSVRITLLNAVQQFYEQHNSSGSDDDREDGSDITDDVTDDTTASKAGEFVSVCESVAVSRLHTLLEREENAAVVRHIVNCLLAVCRSRPLALAPHFKDLIDILVGWHIDSSAAAAGMSHFAAGVMTQLVSHWRRELQFASTLTSQFLEDIDAYATDIEVLSASERQTDRQRRDQLDLITKMIELISVYTSVLTAVQRTGEDIVSCTRLLSPVDGRLSHALSLISRALLVAWHHDTLDRIVFVGCACVARLVCLLGERVDGCQLSLVVQLIQHCLRDLHLLAGPSQLTMCHLCVSLLRECGGIVTVEFIELLLGEQSRLPQLRHSTSTQLRAAILDVYKSALALKNATLLRRAFQLVVDDFQASCRQLEDMCHSDGSESNAVTDDVTTSASAAGRVTSQQYDVTQSEIGERLQHQALFALQALTELVSARNSIIGLWSLNPGLLAILAGGNVGGNVSGMAVYSRRLVLRWPVVLHATLSLLHCHCVRHRHFISTSRLLLVDNSPLTEALSSGENFVTILHLVTRVLDQTVAAGLPETQLMCLQWSAELVQLTAGTGDTRLLGSQALLSLVQQTIQYCLTLTTGAIYIGWLHKAAVDVVGRMVAALSWSQLSEAVQLSVCELCVCFLDCVEERVRNSALALLCHIPVNQFVAVVCRRDGWATRVLSSVRDIHCRREDLCVDQRNYYTFLQLLATGEHWLYDERYSSWLSLVMTSSSVTSSSVRSSLSVECLHGAASSQRPLSVLYARVSVGVAEFLVSNKLRVPPHKRADRCLAELDTQLQLCCRFSPPVGATVALSLLDNVARAIHRASGGCAGAVSTTYNKAVRSFFALNQRTCGEWLRQSRRHLVDVMSTSVWCVPPPLLVSLLSTLLSDGGNKSRDRYFDMLAYAAMRAGCADSVAGVRQMALSSAVECDVTTGWMPAAQLIADHRVGEGANALRIHLSSDEAAYLSTCLRSLLSSQVLQSYIEIGHYDSAICWRDSMQSFDCEPLDGAMSNTDHIRLLCLFSDGDYEQAAQLATQLPSGGENCNLSVTSVEAEVYVSGCLAALHCGKQLPVSSERLENVLRVASERLCFSLSGNSPPSISPRNVVNVQMLHQLVELSHNRLSLDGVCVPFASAVMAQVNGGWGPRRGGPMLAAELDTTTLQMLTRWQQVLSASSCQEFDWQLRLLAVRSLRRHNEQTAAAKLLISAPSISSGVLPSILETSGVRGDAQLCQQLLALCKLGQCAVDARFSADIRREAAKIIYRFCNEQMAFDAVLATPTADVTSRSLLLLARWLRRDRGVDQLQVTADQLAVHLNHVIDYQVCDDLAVTSSDLMIGRLLSGAVGCVSDGRHNTRHTSHKHTTSANRKCWLQWADWCFYHGQSHRRINTNTSSNPGGQLADAAARGRDERLRTAVVAALLPASLGDDVIERVCDVIQQHDDQQDQSQTAIVAICEVASEQSEEQCALSSSACSQPLHRSAQLQSRLAQQFLLPDSVTSQLLELYSRRREAVVTALRSSGTAYLRCLAVHAGGGDSDDVLACLRLLQLLVRPDSSCCGSRQLVTGQQLLDAPPAVWTAVIPQLFALLDHEQAHVRASLVTVVAAVARCRPQLLLFPAVVGSGLCDTRQLPAESDTGLSISEKYRRESCRTIVECLSSHCGDAVCDVSVLVRELRRITLLWPELWLGTLAQCHSDIQRRMASLAVDCLKLAGRRDLSADEATTLATEKYNIAVAPVVYTLERALTITSAEAQTPHERQFQQTYLARIRAAINTLRCPADVWAVCCSGSAGGSAGGWQPFRQLMARLQRQLTAAQPSSSRSHCLALADISPVLADLRETSVCMPGVSCQSYNNTTTTTSTSDVTADVTSSAGVGTSAGFITVRRVLSSVTVLPTKTRPKKLYFCGSDGQRYPYLFKGLEDLHLDERIMQLLDVTNKMLAKQRGVGGCGGEVMWRARNYAVVPLASRSGLIQWVPDSMPLFAVYRRWQQRTASANADGGGIQRPSEMFTARLNAELAARKKANQATPTIVTSAGADQSAPAETVTAVTSAECDQSEPSSSAVVVTSAKSDQSAPAKSSDNVTSAKSDQSAPAKSSDNVTSAKSDQSAPPAAATVVTSSRRQVPSDVLVSVYKQLANETPSDILATELWSGSVSAGDWWRMVRQYCVSLAVMSVVGYLIGLGDRHLDNLLMDTRTGEVVHIDYNICFEKGRTLRIAERVPCRLTQNLVRALGVTGLEGVFRSSCERVLATVRGGGSGDGDVRAGGGGGGDTLLTLLETFVWDPLVDWTPANDLGYTGAVYGGERQAQDCAHRRRAQLRLSVSLFCVQVAEMKQDWLKNRDALLGRLADLSSALKQYKTKMARVGELDERAANVAQRASLLRAAAVCPQHSLFTLPGRWLKHSAIRQNMAEASNKVRSALAELSSQQAEFRKYVSALVSGMCGVWSTLLKCSSTPWPSCSQAVLDFLTAAGQQQLASQCRELEYLMVNRCDRIIPCLRAAVSTLDRVAALLSLIPWRMLCLRSPHTLYIGWLGRLASQLSPDNVQCVRAEFEAVMWRGGDGGAPAVPAAVLANYRQRLHTALALNADRKQLLEAVLPSWSAVDQLNNQLPTLMGVYHVECTFGSVSPHQPAYVASVATTHDTLISAFVSAYRRIIAADNQLSMSESSSTSADWSESVCSIDTTHNSSAVQQLFADVHWLNMVAAVCACQAEPVLQTKADECLQQIQLASAVVQAIRDLLDNFSADIVPKCVRYAQQSYRSQWDHSVVVYADQDMADFVRRIDDVTSVGGVSCDQLIVGLQQCLGTLQHGVALSAVQMSLLVAVQPIKDKFAALLTSPTEPPSGEGDGGAARPITECTFMEQGQMLLALFSGLFDSVHSAIDTLLSHITSTTTTTTTTTLTAGLNKNNNNMHATTNTSTPMNVVCSEQYRLVASLLMFILRISTIRQYFSACVNHAADFAGDGWPFIADPSCGVIDGNGDLWSPLRQYVCHCVKYQLAGVMSHVAGALTLCLLSTHNSLPAPGDVCGGIEQLDALLREYVERQQQKQQKQQHQQRLEKARLIHLQLFKIRECRGQRYMYEVRDTQLRALDAAHCWLHSAHSPTGYPLPATPPPPPLDPHMARQPLLKQLQCDISAATRCASIEELRDQFEQLSASVQQRLKWAAGANQQLEQLCKKHADWTDKVSGRLSDITGLLPIFTRVAKCLTRHQQQQQQSPGIGCAHQQRFSALLDSVGVAVAEGGLVCEGVSGQGQDGVSADEARLAQWRQPLPAILDTDWVSAALHDITELESELGTARVECDEELRQSAAELQAAVTAVQLTLSTLHSLSTDVDTLLRAIAKECEEGIMRKAICNYTRTFDSLCNDTLQLLRSIHELATTSTTTSDTLVERVDSFVSATHTLSLTAGGVCERLLQLASDMAVYGVAVNTLTETHATCNGGGGQINQYALALWRRVRQKLHGRDPDPARHSSVQQQVDYILHEATDVQNLALMYEGWTAWV